MTTADDILCELKVLVRWAAVAFGAPLDLWARETMPRREAERLRGWLGALEAVARALLLALAAGLPKPELSTPRTPRPSGDSRESIESDREMDRSRPETDEFQDSEDSEDSGRWRGVVFAALPRPARSRARGEDAGRGRSFVWSRSLARRLEAVIRVAENPEAYARRLARRLHATPAAVGRRLLAERSQRRPGLPQQAIEAARGVGWRALERIAPDTG